MKSDQYKENDESNKVHLLISSDIWRCITDYIFCDNSQINKRALYNVRNLINIVAMSDYKEEISSRWRINLISVALTAMLDENIFESSILTDYCLENTLKDFQSYIIDFFKETPIPIICSDENIIYTSSIIETKLKYVCLYSNVPHLSSIINDLKINIDNKQLKNISDEFEFIINNAYKEINSVKAINKFSSLDFSLSDDNSISNAFKYTIDELNKSNNFINFGIKYLNTMLDGGAENGRCYLFFGLPKSFKSGLLLNLSIQACKFNKNVELRDKTKKPCVFYLTQENSIKETISRMFVHSTGESIKNFSLKDSINIVRKTISNSTGIDLVIKYRPNKSINTNDFNAMLDELETEGKECILAIQDYTKRIRSANYNADIRLELGEVVNDFTTIAKTRNIPIISAGQLNREAMRVLENALEQKKNDIGKYLNSSHIGESALMVENTDYAIIINKEELLETNEEWLSFKLIASRSKFPTITYFTHPFDNGLKLHEDFYEEKTVSKTSLSTNMDNFNPNVARLKNDKIKDVNNSMLNSLKKINNKVEDNDEILDNF